MKLIKKREKGEKLKEKVKNRMGSGDQDAGMEEVRRGRREQINRARKGRKWDGKGRGEVTGDGLVKEGAMKKGNERGREGDGNAVVT